MAPKPKPQDGALCASLTLDGNPIWVEYDYEPGEPERTYGPPEDCHEGSDESISLLNAHVNGSWVDAELFAQDQQERWHEQIREHRVALRESDLEDAVAAHHAWREFA